MKKDAFSGWPRRDFLKTSAAATLGLIFARLPAMAGPFTRADFDRLIPADKKLSPEWVASLTARGKAAIWKGSELPFIGMPVGGIGCGQLYLAGDGRLWLWDIFKSNYSREPVRGKSFDLMTMCGHYIKPVDSKTGIYNKLNGASVEQGFAIQVRKGSSVQVRTLDSHGFPDVTFRGEYPVGRVMYADRQLPVGVELEAFSPFVPLNAKDSALPATVMAFTVTNSGKEPVEVDLMGWLQNATCPYDTQAELGLRRNTLIQQQGVATLEGTVEAAADKVLETHHGFGSMALSVIGADAGTLLGSAEIRLPLTPEVFAKSLTPGATAARALNEKLVGGLGQTLKLAPGDSQQITFLLTWYFPLHQQQNPRAEMCRIQNFAHLHRHYYSWFTSAAAVAQTITRDSERLIGGTRLWNRTWYDSTLPDWLLTRSFIPVDALSTQVFHWFDNGRPWAWEGVDACPGTCTHVWNYAQAMARLFPELERALREKVDYAFTRNGGIRNRSESGGPATDGHAGTIVRTWREHTMSADDAFLRRVWPATKKAIEFAMSWDPQQKGILEGAQSNTLDAVWFGPMGWISSIYCAALRAGQQMALEMGDAAFAKTCGDIADRGQKEIVARVFNGEYFIHLPPDYKHGNTNKGCHIDQVLGQSWACQLQLPRVLPVRETQSALNAIWKYNFAPDAGGYAIEHTAIKGHRIYAEKGEAGLLTTTWPQGGDDLAVPGMETKKEDFQHWIGPGGYFDECMTGFEYQVAAHMICEGTPGSEMVMHGLAISRAVHDRYAPHKRNPFNEIECSDHYARAMASYGVYLAVCGFEYHGPKGHIGFAPKLTPENFKCAFTSAEGWGSFAQKSEGGSQKAEIAVCWGKLKLKTLALEMKNGNSVQVSLAGKSLPASSSFDGKRLVITLKDIVEIREGTKLELTVA